MAVSSMDESKARPLVEFTPPSAPTATVFILHGLGDTARGWADAVQVYARALPHARFVLPTAPIVPVTLNMGMPMPAWYDIVSLDSDRGSAESPGIDSCV